MGEGGGGRAKQIKIKETSAPGKRPRNLTHDDSVPLSLAPFDCFSLTRL